MINDCDCDEKLCEFVDHSIVDGDRKDGFDLNNQ